MNYPLLLTYITAVSLLVATPGPIIAYILYVVGQYGTRTAVLCVVASNLASLTLLALSAMVLVGAFNINPLVFEIISTVGCFMLLYIAIKMIKQTRYLPVSPALSSEPPKTPSKSRQRVIIHCYLLGIANPKDILFFVSFFPPFIAVTPNLSESLWVLTIAWIICDIAILLAYIFLIKKTMKNYMHTVTKLAAYIIFIVACLAIFYNIKQWWQI